MTDLLWQKAGVTTNARIMAFLAGDDVLLIDAGGYPAGVISAPGGRLDLAGAGVKSRSISNKTDQAGDA